MFKSQHFLTFFLIVIFLLSFLSTIKSSENKDQDKNLKGPFPISILRKSHHDKKSKKGGSKDFDFLLLSLTWPGTMCKKYSHKPHCEIPRGTYNFTIHGLWPSKNFERGPQSCFDIPYDGQVISQLRDLINKYWPDFLGSGTFWKHEWDKHGTCATQLPEFRTQYDYFRKTIKILQQHNFLNMVISGGIRPSFTAINKDEFIGTFKRALGAKPRLSCFNNYISEVRFCVKKDGVTIFDCPGYQGNCPDAVIFPPINAGN